METSELGRHRYTPTTDYRAPSNPLAPIDPPPPSASSSAGRFDDTDRRPREPAESPFRAGYTMATGSAVPASAPYRPHPPASSSSSYSASYQLGGGVQSSVEARRTSDDPEPVHRRSQQSDMSLPSLHEALGSTSTSLGAPSETESSRDLLRSLPPPHSSFSRPPPPEPLSSFPASSRSTLSARANVPPPLPIFEGHPPPTQSYIGRERDMDLRQAAEREPPQLSGGYSHYHQQQHIHPSQHPPPHYSQHGQRPPGQLPLPSLPPASPRQPGSALVSPSDTGRSPYHPDEESVRHNEGALGRPFDAFPYLDALNKIALSSRIIFNFAEAFDLAAREQNGSTLLPSRLPNETEFTVMMENVSNIRQCLDEVKSIVQQTRMHSERARDMARESAARKPLEEEDAHMYHDPSKAPQHQHHPPHHPHHPNPMHPPSAYTLAEVKKRRGRAAPPGRCHSCNRVDTPEWRRGPDGARTLCNACGLHYAKLERKRQSEQRSIRPKPIHDA